MKPKLIVLGYTRSNRQTGYSSLDDGYREDAKQTVITFFIDINGEEHLLTPEDIADAVFMGSNSPYEIDHRQIAGKVQIMLDDYEMRSLSVGDTVTYDGVKVAIEKKGFRRVRPT